MIFTKEINDLKEKAISSNIPIIQDDSLNYIVDYIKKNNIKNILEIGTAVGYSSIVFANISDDINVTTIERNTERYLEAVKNIKKFNLEDRINIIFKDAFDANIDDKFDLIFIDAAKGQNIHFFEKFERNLNEYGHIITDNMNFHGLTEVAPSEIESRNVRQLVGKINKYKEYLFSRNDYEVEILNIGDGIAIASKKED